MTIDVQRMDLRRFHRERDNLAIGSQYCGSLKMKLLAAVNLGTFRGIVMDNAPRETRGAQRKQE